MSTQALSAQQNAAKFTNKKRTIALVIVSLAFIMDLLDSTIVNIAIPSIRANLAASYSAIQWIVAGYSLAFSVLLVTGGRMGDVYGYKKLFMFGVAGFTLASLLSGVSHNSAMLIVARILQGSMAALMVPQVMSLMQVMYKPEERGSINGLFGAMGGMAATLGPIVGGLLIKANVFNLDWRPIFLINVPIGVFGLIAAYKYLPDGKSPHPLKLDLVGTFIIVIAMLLLTFPLIQGRELNWPAWSFVMLALSVPLFVTFIWWQKKKMAIDGSPLVLPSMFKRLAFNIGLSVNFLFEMVMISFFLTFGLVMQIGLNFSPIHAALTGIPVAVGIGLTMAIFGEKVVPKLGRYAMTIGITVMAVGLISTTYVVEHYGIAVHSWQFIPTLLCVGVGMGFVFGSLFAAVLNGIDPKHAGSASGTLNAVQQVGGAIGVALIGVIFFGQLGHSAPASFNKAEPILASSLTADHIPAVTKNAIVKQSSKCFNDISKETDDSKLPASCQQSSSQLNSKIGTLVQNSIKDANANNFANALKWAMSFGIGVLILTFGLVFLLPRKFKTEAYQEI